ncbi:hypothetical protein Taro_015197 [Colocasia esculenta]|uniref:Uncharacterized protein n=1 Tax=Colocasia esculenta TaxID=4460 RepID=A0A843USF0_COLES|nr:hypothetical protein [Colocasia esculenta]
MKHPITTPSQTCTDLCGALLPPYKYPRTRRPMETSPKRTHTAAPSLLSPPSRPVHRELVSGISISTPSLRPLQFLAFPSTSMTPRRVCVLLLIVAVVAVVLSREGVVRAARDAPRYLYRSSSYLQYPSAYEKARSAIACWLEKLDSGPSPQGPSH